MSQTAQEFAEKNNLNPEKNDANIKPNIISLMPTSLGISSAIAHAGKAWADLPAEERTSEKALAIATQSVPNEDLFLDKAGTKDLVNTYNGMLIERTYAKDKAENVEKGTNLKKFLDGVANALEGVDFDKVKSGNLQGTDVGKIKADISKAAKEFVGITGTVEQDLIKTIMDNPDKFKDVAVQKAQPNSLILTFAQEYLKTLNQANPEQGAAEPKKIGVLTVDQIEKLAAKMDKLPEEGRLTASMDVTAPSGIPMTAVRTNGLAQT
jgi:hypothetical protein